MNTKLKRIWLLFVTFFKIGAFTFGGGYAMIAFINREIVERRQWLTDDDILDIIAIAESTPGPIAINSATFVGYKVAGFWGAFFATAGTVLPSFAIILIISFALTEFSDIKAVQYAFFGIRAGVLSLILGALIKMYKKAPKGLFSYLVMAISLICAAFLKINVIYIIIACGVLGLLNSFIAARRNKQ